MSPTWKGKWKRLISDIVADQLVYQKKGQKLSTNPYKVGKRSLSGLDSFIYYHSQILLTMGLLASQQVVDRNHNPIPNSCSTVFMMRQVKRNVAPASRQNILLRRPSCKTLGKNHWIGNSGQLPESPWHAVLEMLETHGFCNHPFDRLRWTFQVYDPPQARSPTPLSVTHHATPACAAAAKPVTAVEIMASI